VNTINPTSTANLEMQAWCAEVRALHAIESRPIEDGDPRLDALRERGAYVDPFSPEELGELYFSMSGKVAYPDCPLPRPAWATQTTYFAATYPEIVIEHTGKQHGTDEFSAQLTLTHTVYVDNLVENSGTTRLAGDVDFGEARVDLGPLGRGLPIDDARILAAAITSAAGEGSSAAN
jgi:hypothetical protein